MKKQAAIVAERPIALAGRYICKGIFAILFLVFFGCATTPPKPVTITQEKTSPGSDAVASSEPSQKGPTDSSMAALVDLLKSKNMISPEEAARLSGQPVTPGAEEKEQIEKIKAPPGKAQKKEGTAAASEWSERVRFGGDIRLRSESDRSGKDTPAAESVTIGRERTPSRSDVALSDSKRQKGTADQEIAALVALLKSKNVISAEEASRLTAQLSSPVGEKSPAVTSEVSEEERIEKITARAIEQAMKNIQEEVRKQVREELAKEMKEQEKKQVEAITASVTEEIKKSLPEQVKGEVRIELPAEVSKKESEKITASVTEELKKGFQEQVKTEVREQVKAEVQEQVKTEVQEQVKTEVQEQVKTEVQEQVAKEVKGKGMVEAVAQWFKEHIQFAGDVRLRFRGDFYDDNNADFVNPSNPTEIINSKVDRYIFQLRARFGVTAKVADQLEAGFRISTGYTNNPVTENVVLGDYENNKNVVIDRAYVRWNPAQNLFLWAGRFENPFFHPYTEIVWDNDLALDGFAAKYTYDFNDRYSLFGVGVVSPLQEFELSSRDRWLYGFQLGFQGKPHPDVTYTLASAYYNFTNVTGKPNSPLRPGENDYTAVPFLQKGNTLFNINPPGFPIKLALASEFRVVDFTGELDLGFWKPVYITLLGDYVWNTAFDRSKVALLTGNPNVKEDTYAYQVGLAVGHKEFRKFGDWNTFFFYKYVQGDAVIAGFTDSDFHAGGTNAKGWILGGSLAFHKNVWLTLRWMSTDQVKGPKLAIDTVMLDLNVKY